jgi:DNA-binding transcriptional MocR family regulator
MTTPISQIVRRPGIIELGWGHPDPVLLPVAALRRASAAAMDQFGAETLEYGHPAGPGPLLNWLTERIGQNEGRRPEPDEIMTTGGISQGLDQLLSCLTVPGDTLLVESPTYHLAIRIMRDHALNLVPVPTDDDGLLVDELAATLKRLKAERGQVRALYLVPTFNNPTGHSLSDARREALVTLAAAEELLIIEDDVYRELAYDGAAPASLWSLAPPGVVARLGSFSKSLAPGLRLGWLTAGQDLISRLVNGGLLDSGGGVNHFTAMIVAALCATGDYDTNLAELRAAYRHRRDALVTALRKHLPGDCEVSLPRGGFFVWVQLPDAGMNRALLARAEAGGVSFVPGDKFYLAAPDWPGLRLAFSLYPPETLADSARRLGRAVKGL